MQPALPAGRLTRSIVRSLARLAFTRERVTSLRVSLNMRTRPGTGCPYKRSMQSTRSGIETRDAKAAFPVK